MPPFLTFYTSLGRIVTWFTPGVLRQRAKAGKEDVARMGERMARPSRERPQGPLVWLHGASVGEGLSLLPIIEGLRIRRPDVTLLMTSGTVGFGVGGNAGGGADTLTGGTTGSVVDGRTLIVTVAVANPP